MREGGKRVGRGEGPQVRAVSVLVSDLDASVDFYTEVLGLKLRVDERRYNWVELGPEDPVGRIALVQRTSESTELGGPTGILLVVGDLHGLHKRASSMGVKFILPPQRRPWRGIIAKIEDPDGNTITLMDREMISPWMMGA